MNSLLAPKLKPKALSLMIALTTLGIGCQPQNPTSPPESEAKLTVITTFLPMTQFTKAVAGDRAEVIQLLPTNVGPHDYQARPEDLQRLSQAQVLVKNGLGMEEFLDDLIANAENPNLKVIDTSQGIEPIRSGDIGGQDHHDHHHNHSQRYPYRPVHNDGTPGHHHHGEYNPHIWLDPKRAVRQVETIRDGLIAVDPEGETTYQANAAAYIAQLQTLDQEITTKLRPFQGKTFVAFHDFAPYFAQSYNLNAVFLVDIPEANPTPEDVRRISQAVQSANLKAILTEPQAQENTFIALAQDLNVTISQFDPLETGPATATEPSYYLTTMRQNVDNLLSAFGAKPQTSSQHWQIGQANFAVTPVAVTQVKVAP